MNKRTRKSNASWSRGPSRLKDSRKQPPSVSAALSGTHTFRFIATTAGYSGPVTFNDLFTVPGFISSGGAAGNYTTCSAVRVRKVEMWAPMLAATPTTCSLTWAGEKRAPSRELTDTTMSTAEPAHLVSAPPKGSFPDMWFNTADAGVNNDTVFSITVPIGAVVDVTLTFQYSDSERQGYTFTTSTAGTAASTYYGPLDRVTTGATPIMLPVSLAYLR